MEFSLEFELQKLLGCVKKEPSDKPKEKYSCSKCQKTFISEVSFSKHEEFVHALTKKKETKFKCKLCSNVYKSRKSFNVHFKSKHEGFRHKCSHCGKQYFSLSSLKQHVDTLHKNLFFDGSHCPKRLRSKEKLRIHIRVHQDVQELIKCDNCLKSFTRSDNLQRHIRSVHRRKCIQ